MKNIELENLKAEKSQVYHKIHNMEKSGKEVPAELRTRLMDLNNRISEVKKAPVESPAETKKVSGSPAKVSKKSKKSSQQWPDLTYKQAEKELSTWLDENDYEEGYQFRHSNNFFMNRPKISQDRKTKMLRFGFRLSFLTKSRKVTKDIEWEVPYGQWSRIGNRLEALEKVILKETSDPDRSDQVFGYDRFQRNLFFERGYDKNGWRIRK